MKKETQAFYIGDIKLKNRYILGPMAGYTDFAYRKICAENGASLVYTEMISANALAFNSKETLRMIQETKLDKEYRKKHNTKLALQLFGGETNNLVKAIPILEKEGDYDFLDINLGCSVSKVLKQHACAYFVDKPDELEKMLTEVVNVSTKPVIVKTRIGPTDNDITIYNNLKIFEKLGIKMVAIHARSRKALYTGRPFYDVIKRCKDSTSKLTIVANGDISTNNANQVLNSTNADAIMIARNSLGYPKIFQDLINLEINNNDFDTSTSLLDQINTLLLHIEYMKQVKDDFHLVSIMRSIAPSYFKSFQNVKTIRSKLVTFNHTEELINYLNSLKNNKELIDQLNEKTRRFN